MKVELFRILIWVYTDHMTKEVRPYSADKTSKNYRVYQAESSDRLLPHDTIMKPMASYELTDMFLNIWCFEEQISEAEEILIQYATDKLDRERQHAVKKLECIADLKCILADNKSK